MLRAKGSLAVPLISFMGSFTFELCVIFGNVLKVTSPQSKSFSQHYRRNISAIVAEAMMGVIAIAKIVLGLGIGAVG